MRRAIGAAALAVLGLLAAPSPGVVHTGAMRAASSPSAPLGAPIVLLPTSYLAYPGAPERRYRLEAHPGLTLLARHREPSVERPPEWRSYLRGHWGPARVFDGVLSWSPTSCEVTRRFSPRASLFSPEPLELEKPALLDVAADAAAAVLDAARAEPVLLPVVVARPCPWWKKPRAVTVVRQDSETDRFALVDCDGAIAPDALDRLSVLARPLGAPRPELPLPPEPEGVEPDEWAPSVKLLHPRLMWVVARLSSAFPGKLLRLASGYRRDGHGTLHARGRALDLAFRGVDNERLYAECRKLADVGCGFYPNHPFVHIDVRPYGSGRPTWIDVSQPGEPSRYVDEWPSTGGAQ